MPVRIAASIIEGPFLVRVGSFDSGDVPQTKDLMVPSLEEASNVCSSYIEEEGIGGRDWAGGEVFKEGTKECVAVVSYNGRVWKAVKHPTDPWHIPDGETEYVRA